MANAWKVQSIDESVLDLSSGNVTVTVVYTDGVTVDKQSYSVGSQAALDRLVKDRTDRLNAATTLKSSVTLPDVGGAPLTKGQVTALRAAINPALSDVENVVALNETIVDNPEPQGMVPRLDDTAWALSVFDSLSDAFHKTWWGYPTIAKFVHALQFQSLRQTLSFFITSGLRSGNLSPEDAQIIADARDSQVPDPMWTDEVTMAVAILGRDCTLSDVASMREK